MKRHTLGIDEAGRGPAIGQMVMAAVCLDTTAARRLSRAGLTDSKSYGAGDTARAKRKQLASLVLEYACFTEVAVIDVTEIDRRVKLGELNVLEREVATRFINNAHACDRIIADGTTLFAPLRAQYPHLEALNKAESRHAAVAAASVLAKNRRDELFAHIAKRYQAHFGEITGGGYVNAGTRRFLTAYAEQHRCLPPEARRSWPHPYVKDVLGEGFDPFSDLSRSQQVGQLALV